ncbi:phosphatidylinositol 3,4,5-trisphosphate 5-phosphatase 2B-like [Acipenser oxyrinchus oxyrinchus]|uniref:phosphatidylinositol-3,4,5-trisphosphate 5-phosphatase n=1 Tax=Acipenser oxyrinchus oxyrinchus TaxID=40147 RepID=A0AAD8G3N0_ACIOX|nr:phosphatidylinositol 3,4,5-trisphosphate 5-phosphatase 2B-like [Acipenser oxyrinchus oxyrinchus]
MATAAWYHRDISRVQAEDYLARAGRDGSFLVRDSESVPGAYALCLLFQCHVHTYRILPDEEGLLAVQTTQGVQVNCFRTLADLVLSYQQPRKGLVIPLLYPVGHHSEPGDDGSDGEDERPCQVLSQSAVQASPSSAGTGKSSPSPPHPAQTSIPLLLQQRLQEMGPPSGASDLIGLASEYLRTQLHLDLEGVRNGNSNLQHFSKALGAACGGLHSEIDLTLSSLETLAKVFDDPSPSLTLAKTQGVPGGGDSDLGSLITKISSLNSLLSSLERKVLNALQEAVSNHSLTVPSAPPTGTASIARRSARVTPVHTFQVKVARAGRLALHIDVDGGRLIFDKRPGASHEECVSHDKILQLVKYQSAQNRLRMVLDSQKNQQREVMFENARKREAFCQLLQLMKMRHSKQDEPDVISVFVGTWNMGNAPPPHGLTSWLTSTGLGRVQDETTAALPHDVYAIGTQENTLGEREWAEHLRGALRSITDIDFKLVALQTLWNIKLAVLVKPEHEHRISHVGTSSVKTGLGNTLGNKGAVGVSFLFNGTSFGFVNCHLTSGSDKTIRRNQNYQDILRLLSLGDKQLSAFDISLRFTHLFWCGDLNYRLDLDVEEILRHVTKREFEELMCADQLTRERDKRKAFLHFNEEEIAFPPTYRYERGSRDCYLWQKYKTTGVRINVPSWCDRVLWKSYPETHLVCTSYGCTDDITTSDHSPVFASFQVGVTSQFISKKDPGLSVERACIELEGIEAIVKTASKSKFFIEFHSCCLEEFRRSSENDAQSCEVTGFLKLGWSAKQLPKLTPILPDMEYLRDQHMLLSVKSCDGYESYGECCIALRSLIGSTAQQFEMFLTHRAEEMGSIRGRIRVCVPKDRRGTRERIYECFCFEKDENGEMRGGMSPRTPLSHGASAPVSPETPSSYTNPAYFIFEAVVPPQKGPPEGGRAPPASESQPVWRKDPTLHPKLLTQDSKSPRRANFAEIEIPGYPPHYRSPRECTLQPGSSYQLFPAKDRAPVSTAQPRATPETSLYSDQSLQYSASLCKDLPSPNRDQQNYYMKHAGVYEDQSSFYKVPRKLNKDPPLFYKAQVKALPPRRSRAEAAARWIVEPQFGGKAGDHSLTALQIAKSLSEVDFQPIGSEYSVPRGRGRGPVYGVPAFSDVWSRGGCWEPHPAQREALAVRGVPGTVREWLRVLGLQRYEMGLILKGWNELEYFSDITEEDLLEAGVRIPAHRRVILENLREIWD